MDRDGARGGIVDYQTRYRRPARILRADTKRLAWFLDLKHIVKFSKYSLAPLPVLRLFKKSVLLDPEAARRAHPTSEGDHGGSLPPNRPTAPALTLASRTTSKSNGEGLRRGSAALTQLAVELSAGRTRLRTPRSGSLLIPPAQHLRGQTAGRLMVNLARPALPSDRSLTESPDPSHRMGRLVPLAPIHVSPTPGDFTGLGSNALTLSASAGTQQTGLGASAVISGIQQSDENSEFGRQQSASTWQAGPHTDDQPKRSRSTASTLHIDGAALGRWTVQHLERVLQRPTVGMTGVDPRATVPRNRVSPF